MDTNRDSAHQSQNEDNFPTFSLGLEFLNETKKRKTTEEETRHQRRHDSLLCHFWYCCPFLTLDLMHNSTGYVMKQYVHTFGCALSSYGARGKFGANWTN